MQFIERSIFLFGLSSFLFDVKQLVLLHVFCLYFFFHFFKFNVVDEICNLIATISEYFELTLHKVNQKSVDLRRSAGKNVNSTCSNNSASIYIYMYIYIYIYIYIYSDLLFFKNMFDLYFASYMTQYMHSNSYFIITYLIII